MVLFSVQHAAHAAKPSHAKKRVVAAALPRDVNLTIPADTASYITEQLSEPIPGAWVTSSFGWRRNPVLKFRRFHAGVDFRAAVGTQVHAAGEGTIEKIGRAKDRGLFVIVRHNEQLVSGYSHLSATEPGLHVGDHVSDQQTIGRVGRSGWTTGPNLHFEVLINGSRVDPGIILARTRGGRVLAARDEELLNFGKEKSGRKILLAHNSAASQFSEFDIP